MMRFADAARNASTAIRKRKWELLTLVGLFLLAFAIRSVGIRQGLNGRNEIYAMHTIDELGVLNAAMSIGSRQYVYILLYYPFFYYLSFFVFAAYYLALLPTGQFSGWPQFYARFLRDNSDYLLLGRYWAVFLASLTVVATYFVGKKMFGRRIGLFASLFLLFSFGHIVNSGTFRLDTFLPLVFLIAFYLILNALDEREGRLWPFVLCGIAIGLAGATKVTGWALLGPYLLLGFVKDGRFTLAPLRTLRFDRRWVYSLVVAVAVYVMLAIPGLTNIGQVVQSAAAPIVDSTQVAGADEIAGAVTEIGDDPAATDASSAISGELTQSIRFVNASSLSPYTSSFPWHVTNILPRALGITIYLPAIVGLVLMLFDKRRRVQVVIFLTLLVTYFVPIGLASRTAWRDMLPIIPFLAISAGFAVDAFLRWLFKRSALHGNTRSQGIITAVLMILLLTLPWYNIYRQKSLISKNDTRELATSWIEENLASGTIIATETYGPSIVDMAISQVNTAYGDAVGLVPDASPADRPVYQVHQLVTDLSIRRDYLDSAGILRYLEDNSVEYVILSSGYYGRFYNDAIDLHSPERAVRGRAFHDRIASNLELVERFVPDWKNRPGPVIQIFRVPQDLDVEGATMTGEFDPFSGLEPPASSVGDYQFSPR